ncbi:hypothetical protein [Anaerosolibacter sp.]|jgi:hypothetical protein|uniref:hypothetical protein n=1 Tax=Anaerosolibacter sp. TaxID=1872527 RepID=UPI0026292187|nr:hypothetical protein [Anaerosolibacter sp.]MDF2547108.1 hypothetical protein [Anaerosolibacter sp.]
MEVKYRRLLWVMMLVIVISFATVFILNNKSGTNKYTRAKLIYIQENAMKQRL